MKNIAVLAHGLSVEYCLTVIEGISDFFKDKDVRLIIAQTQQAHYNIGLYQYQYWANAELLKSKSIDGIIVVSGSYTSDCSQEELRSIFTQFPDKPIISIAADPKVDGVYFSLCDCDKVYDSIVNHLKNVHGCKNFAYLSANKTQSDEALARFEAYKKALKKHNLEFDENRVYDGKFTRSSINETLHLKIKSKDDVKFDALLSANDIMATAAMEYLTELGLSIPKDVKVIGFDNTSHASMCNPTLSTVDQQISYQGYNGAEVLWNVLSGKVTSFKNLSDLGEIYRQSCGCIAMEDKTLSFKTGQGILNRSEKSHHQLLNLYLDTLGDMNRIPTLMDCLKTNRTIESTYENLVHILGITGFKAMGICFYDEPVTVNREDNFVVPEKARLYMYMDNEINERFFDEDGLEFSPLEKLFPQLPRDSYKGEFFIYPIFSAEEQYGYTICKLSKYNYSTANVYLRILNNSFVQSYQYTKAIKEKSFLQHENQKLLDNNSTLHMQSKTDELTKILNRRGFMQYGQQLIDFSLEMDTPGLVIFADLDGLKTINDTFGHLNGDIAIATEAQVLKESFRKSDVTGRLSGDEFAVVAPGLTLEQLSFSRNKVIELNKKYSEEKNLPFKLSLSLGAVEFKKNKSNLKELLSEADEVLYLEKKEKHSKSSK